MFKNSFRNQQTSKQIVPLKINTLFYYIHIILNLYLQSVCEKVKREKRVIKHFYLFYYFYKSTNVAKRSLVIVLMQKRTNQSLNEIIQQPQALIGLFV